MAWYRSGTVTATAGQNVITGTGTQWANNVMGVAPGQALIVPRPDGNTLIYEILAVDSDTKIRINGNVVDALTSSNYGIQTSVSNSYSALARETSAQLALYQQLLQDWQQITTGTGNITIIAPDGTEVVIPSLAQISQDISNKISQQQLSVIGIGSPVITGVANFDFQNFVYTSGANYLTSSVTWLNIPAGISFANGYISITVDYISAGNRVGLTLIPDTTGTTNFKVFKVLSVGAVGSRVFTVREEWTSANPVPISGGGHGANTLAGAQSALGIVTDAFGAGQVSGTPWVNMTLINGWTVLSASNRCRYRKVLGLIFIEFAAAAGTDTAITTLPTGFRPAVNIIAPAVGTPQSTTGISPRMTILPAGGVYADGYAAGSPITAVFCFSLQ